LEVAQAASALQVQAGKAQQNPAPAAQPSRMAKTQSFAHRPLSQVTVATARNPDCFVFDFRRVVRLEN